VTYFSDRENGPKAQTDEVISSGLWGGLASLIQGKLDDHSLGHGSPKCVLMVMGRVGAIHGS